MQDGATEMERQILENMYQELEAGYNNIYRIIATLEERRQIIRFVASMFCRNNVWKTVFDELINYCLVPAFELVQEHEKGSAFLETSLASFAVKYLGKLESGIKSKIKKRVMRTAMKSIHELSSIHFCNDIISVIHTNNELLTSDNPVTTRPDDPTLPLVPMDPMNNILSMPIDAHHLLLLRPSQQEFDRCSIERIVEDQMMSPSYVEVNNQFHYAQAGRFLLGSEKAIKDFKVDTTMELLKSHLL